MHLKTSISKESCFLHFQFSKLVHNVTSHEASTTALSWLSSDGGSNNFRLTCTSAGTLNMSTSAANAYITGISTNSAVNTSVVTVGHLNDALLGRNAKNAVVAVSTDNVDLSGGLVVGTVIDGVTLALNDRVLLVGQTDSTENGIYLAPASGTASRSEDMNATNSAGETGEIPGALVWVGGGTTNAGKQYVVTSPSPLDAYTLDVTSITFTPVQGSGGLSTTLNDAQVYVGNSSNEATARTLTGDVTISNTGVTSISSGVIVNDDINASANIDASKVNLQALTVGTGLDGTASSYTPDGAATISINANQTAIQTMYNSSLIVGNAADEEFITFDSSDNEIQLSANNVTQLRVTDEGGTGKLYIRGTYQVFSDPRIKSDPSPLDNSVQRLMALEAVKYQRKRRDGTFNERVEVGVMADRTQKAMPEAVSVCEGEGFSDLKTVDPYALTALLIDVCQKQQREIEQLRADVDALKSQ